jgi:hypothetical protein
VKQRIQAAAEGKLPHSRPLLLFPEVGGLLCYAVLCFVSMEQQLGSVQPL